MNRFLFICFTLIGGFLMQLVLDRYLSLYNATPQILLLLVVAFGFYFGPLMGETLGFFWGLMTDSMGVSLFGINALVLTLAGYVAGQLRRRVASERAAGQLVIALVTTLYYWLLVPFLYSIFEEGRGGIPYLTVILEMLLNIIFVSGVFWLVDQWIDMWRLEREHM